MAASGIHAMLQLLADAGVRYLFGNPGTTELPLVDALVDHDRIRYVLALQEVPVMAMADGYAQASRSPGVVNLHISCGLGNGMGMLYNAYRSGTPLVVTAGQQDRRMMFEEPILWGDMVGVVRPWTKWAAEVQQVEDVPAAVRRAVQTAMMPPTGPVFLSLPLDVQMGRADWDMTPPQLPDPHVRPPREAVHRAAEVLALSKTPGILVGSRICEADAVEALVAVAERLGAPVIHEAYTSHGRSSFPSDHPLAAGLLPFWSPDVRRRLAEFDVLLVAGMKLMQQYIHHEPSRAVPEHVRLVHLDDDPWELGKNYPVEVGVVGHPKPSLEELASRLDAVMTPEGVEAAKARAAQHGETHRKQREALRREAEGQRDVRPMTPLSLLESLAQVLPDDVAVIEEAPTTSGAYFERAGVLKNTDGFFAQRGWALGWGLNCAIGVKLAWPDRPVLALIGDGSAMYGIQGLWTAAHYRLPITVVITNNTEYKILKNCAQVLKLPEACAQRFLGLDVVDPTIDYVGLSQSLGVPARRITEPDELSQAVRQSLAGDAPQLFEVPVKDRE
ncbi:MAG TPA: thiamine pyrophosphate-binding protein [Thermoguttaceae bacterium]|nr:thiamine pyrophosphate-binding protein [Thermoguttaceae bacterium]